MIRVSTHVKSGVLGGSLNHNETRLPASARRGLVVKTHVKSGVPGGSMNHNETRLRASVRRGLVVKT